MRCFLVGLFHPCICASSNCCVVSQALCLINLSWVSLLTIFVQLTFCITMSLLMENNSTLWPLSLCSYLSPSAQMPLTDADTVLILGGQRSQTLGANFMTFCDIFVRHSCFPPEPPLFCFLKGNIKA